MAQLNQEVTVGRRDIDPAALDRRAVEGVLDWQRSSAQELRQITPGVRQDVHRDKHGCGKIAWEKRDHPPERLHASSGGANHDDDLWPGGVRQMHFGQLTPGGLGLFRGPRAIHRPLTKISFAPGLEIDGEHIPRCFLDVDPVKVLRP
jgi:hypothetical protein